MTFNHSFSSSQNPEGSNASASANNASSVAPSSASTPANLHAASSSSFSASLPSSSPPLIPSRSSPRQHHRSLSTTSDKSSHLSSDPLPADDTVLSYKLFEGLRSGDLAFLTKLVNHVKTAFPNYNGKLQFDKALHQNLGSPLHLAIAIAPSSCSDWLIKHQYVDVNEPHPQTGETPLHYAAKHGRMDILDILLHNKRINDNIRDKLGKFPVDVAKNKEVADKLRNQQNLFIFTSTALMHDFSTKPDAFKLIKNLFSNPRVASLVTIHHMDPATGSTVLHEAAKRNDVELLTWCLMEQKADPFVRDRKGKYFYELSKDEKIKALFKEAVPNVQPAAKASSNESPKLSGLLYKWTNYASGYKARWFVLEDGLLSYYKNQDDIPDSCRGSISMKVADIYPESSDRHRFDVVGKGSIRYHLRAEHVAEAQRWIQALNQSKKVINESITQLPDQAISEIVPASSDDLPGSPLSPDISDPSLDEDSIPGLPYETEFPMLRESCQAQLELQKSLLASFQAQLMSLQRTEADTTNMINVASSFQSSITSFQDLFRDLIQMCQEREVYWGKICDVEKQHKMIYEANLRKLASDYDNIETEARFLVSTLQRQSKADRKKSSKAKKGTSATSPNFPANQSANDTLNSSGNSKSSTFSGNEESDAEGTGTLSDTNEAILEEEEEFFDAIGSGDEHNYPPSALENHGTTLASNESQPMMLITSALKGYESDNYTFCGQLRSGLPVDHALLKNEVSLWSVLKNAIGKDLSKITLPVYFNEPISILQRLCEDIEYSQLLDLAWKQTQSDERMLYVAAFAVSSYASTVGRTGKPFNPLLGETFEYVRKDKGFRYVSEQVSHHPPISACHCESNHYAFYGEVNMKNKFWGKSLEIHPLGVSHVVIKRDHVNEPDEHYSWRKVTTCVHNLIVGTLWIDHYGDMEIINHRTMDKCVLTFKPTGWRNKDRCAVEGKVYPQGQSTPSWELWGTWDDKFLCRPLTGHSSSLINTDAEDDAMRKSYVLWKRFLGPPLTASNFNLTSFALTLNQLPPTLPQYVCPTDSRLRPDQRAMENGDYDLAAKEKHRLEEKQRATRKKNEELGQKTTPRWFVKQLDSDSGDGFWEFTHEYWKERESEQWTNVPDIY